MESPTLSDWVAIVAQACTALLMVAMGFSSRSPRNLTSRAVGWGLLFCLPWLWEDAPAMFLGLVTFPLIFILLMHVGYGIRWVLVRVGFLDGNTQDGPQATDGAGQG